MSDRLIEFFGIFAVVCAVLGCIAAIVGNELSKNDAAPAEDAKGTSRDTLARDRCGPMDGLG